MIGLVAMLLVGATLAIGLRATSGWLDRWHPIDRLVMALVIGGMMLAIALDLSQRWGLTPAGLGLAFSLAPVGVFDTTKWWFRARRAPWPGHRHRRAPWILAVRWLSVFVSLLAVVAVLMTIATRLPPQ